MVALSDLDENKLDRIIAHRQSTRTAESRNHIITRPSGPVSVFISEDGETVTRQIQQIQKRFSQEEAAQIACAYQNGKSTNELARKYGCHRKTISAQLKKQGIEVSLNKYKTEEEVRRIVSLYEKGSTIEEIANRHEVSTATINRLLHENRVSIRSRWDYARR